MKKQNMFKAILFTILAVAVLTWLIPTGTISGSEVISQGLQRIGLYDVVEYSLLGFEYFANVLLLIIGVGLFYGVLSKSTSYTTGVNKLAKSLKGHETLVLIIITIFFALLTSICGFNTLAFLIIPLFIAVITAIGYDKMTAFLATFGATLIANIGSIYNQNLNAYINSYLSGDYTTNLLAKVALLVVPMVIYMFFVLKYASTESKKEKKKEDAEKTVAVKKAKTNNNSTAVMVLLGVMILVIVLACTPWESVFQLEFFSKITESILGVTIGGHKIFSYILGGIPAFGEYGIEEVLVLLTIADIVIALVSKMSYQDVIDGAREGVSKVAPVVVATMIAHSVLAIAIYYPILPTIEGFLLHLVPNFNVLAIFTTGLTTSISTILNVDPMYITQQALPMMASVYPSNLQFMALVAQASYGLTALVSPTSLMLVMGLVYLDIPYTTWIKTAWKTILEILVIVLVILLAVFFIV